MAELSPVRRIALPAAALLERWRHLPEVDNDALRADLDEVIDPGR